MFREDCYFVVETLSEANYHVWRLGEEGYQEIKLNNIKDRFGKTLYKIEYCWYRE